MGDDKCQRAARASMWSGLGGGRGQLRRGAGGCARRSSPCHLQEPVDELHHEGVADAPWFRDRLLPQRDACEVLHVVEKLQAAAGHQGAVHGGEAAEGLSRGGDAVRGDTAFPTAKRADRGLAWPISPI